MELDRAERLLRGRRLPARRPLAMPVGGCVLSRQGELSCGGLDDPLKGMRQADLVVVPLLDAAEREPLGEMHAARRREVLEEISRGSAAAMG